MNRKFCNCGKGVEHPHHDPELPEHCDRCIEEHEEELGNNGEPIPPELNEDDPRIDR